MRGGDRVNGRPSQVECSSGLFRGSSPKYLTQSQPAICQRSPTQCDKFGKLMRHPDAITHIHSYTMRRRWSPSLRGSTNVARPNGLKMVPKGQFLRRSCVNAVRRKVGVVCENLPKTFLMEDPQNRKKPTRFFLNAKFLNKYLEKKVVVYTRSALYLEKRANVFAPSLHNYKRNARSRRNLTASFSDADSCCPKEFKSACVP